MTSTNERAVLAGGCFWGIEGVYEHVLGVRKVVSGYAGGEASTANYDDVSSGRSGHAEAVEITFDPQKVPYGEILRIFFSVAHDPTQLNRQGPDTGTQYRSAIFYADDMQSYHQDFIAKNPRYPYVVFNDLPKIRNLKQLFPELYREGS